MNPDRRRRVLHALDRYHPVPPFSVHERAFYRVRGALLERWRFPDVEPEHWRPLLADLHALLEQPGFGLEESERCVEIPWCLGRYRGERRVLEVGHAAAEDRYLVALVNLGIPELVGLDQTATGWPWIKEVVADVREIPHPGDEYDLVLCISTIEHVGTDTTMYGGERETDEEGDFRGLAELVRVTRPSGRVLLTVPYGEEFHGGWYRHYGATRLRRLVESVPVRVTAEDYFRYRDDVGWVPAGADDLVGVRYQDGGAPHAAGLACLELTVLG